MQTPEQRGADEIPLAALAALKQGKKLEAIKLLRAERGIDLKTAKQRIDAYASRNPQFTKAGAASGNSGSGFGKTLLAVLIVALLIWLLTHYAL